MGLKSDFQNLKRTKPIPKGWRNAKQIMAAEDMSKDQVKRALAPLIEAGQWETQKWTIQKPDGTLLPIPIYRKKP